MRHQSHTGFDENGSVSFRTMKISGSRLPGRMYSLRLRKPVILPVKMVKEEIVY